MNFKLATLYVGDLHPEVTEAMLVWKFSPSGHLHSVRVCKKWETGASLGYAYVNFYQQSDAERALETLNCVPIMGKPMRVMWCQRDSTIRKSGVGNLFIRNLDVETDDNLTLFDLFSCFGKVLSCKVVAYKTGTKGYGYVQFESQKAANLAKERLDGKLFNNHPISVEHFKSREEREKPQNKQKELQLFIKNLDEHINNEYLHREFSKFGTVTKAKVIIENGRSRGFGFVHFSSAKEATKAMSQMNGRIWGGKQIFVEVARRKEERQPQIPAVGQSPGPPQVPAVGQSPAPPQVSPVGQSPAPPQVPAVGQSPAPPQVPAVAQKTLRISLTGKFQLTSIN
ncbi:polyadenylate-binding protein 1-like 2 [Silurus meridionalis]|uniref:RRM domain-containing protein n=1 Tax=Silurus meridionalis TaxID=175797 RepID=A0A8T0AVI2_SILME|nr:polyadenylate-binding protein 1-like 2 [Silurus meridionalis]KAF7697294.1 hypothetical protein HF521_005712 [Silurus meridionalis]